VLEALAGCSDSLLVALLRDCGQGFQRSFEDLRRFVLEETDNFRQTILGAFFEGTNFGTN
jgi:hypothetical protein